MQIELYQLQQIPTTAVSVPTMILQGKKEELYLTINTDANPSNLLRSMTKPPILNQPKQPIFKMTQYFGFNFFGIYFSMCFLRALIFGILFFGEAVWSMKVAITKKIWKLHIIVFFVHILTIFFLKTLCVPRVVKSECYLPQKPQWIGFCSGVSVSVVFYLYIGKLLANYR